MRGRICLATVEYPPDVGGVGVAAQRLARNLVHADFDVHVVTQCDVPGGPSEVRTTDEDGVAVHRLLDDRAANPHVEFSFRQLLRRLDEEESFDLFHGFFLTVALPCVLASERRVPPRPVIASIRGADVLMLINQPYSRGVILAALRKATWVTSVNQVYLDRVAEEVAIAGCSSVIRNGVKPPGDGGPWKLDAANRGTVGTIGQMRRVKDIPLLIRAFAGVSPRHRRRLLLAGFFSEADEEEWSEVLIDELGLADAVEITGRFAHSDVGRHLDAMHVYVQSSAYEGLPNALLEAASVGVPIVATDVGGMAEILVDGDNALVVPHGEPRLLAAAIERVLADDELARHLSDGARRLAAELSPERERDQWMALYEALLPTPR